jgi:uncharacterized protein (UPF0264 family)
MTQLLVSVRNADEAVAAVRGGAHIIDVKEPHQGSLGCATPEVIVAIAEAIREVNDTQLPLSLALGELPEWQFSDRDVLREAIQTAAPQFLKLGLADVATGHGNSSWIVEWQRVRVTVPGDHEWVAVAYADHERARAPAVDSVLKAAVEADCRILLIDTYTKNAESLFSQMSLDALQTVRRQTNEHGLKLALAGSVALSDLPLLFQIQPDIIAVRGAVCEHGNRIGTVSEKLVQEFCLAISRQW